MIVYIPGVWDLLHTGHITVLERAKALGDRLIVGVAGDEITKQDKGERPIINERDRVRMVQSLKCVSVAMPYYELEFCRHLDLVKPDVLAVGETWGTAQRHKDAERWCDNWGCRFVKLPYSREESTTKIKERIRANG